MTEPSEVELWPCGYDARCSARGCRRRATTILGRLDDQGRLDEAEACDAHTSELCAGMKVIDQRRRAE